MYPECFGISAEPRNYLDGSTGCYRSTYPVCREQRGAPYLSDAYRRVPQVAKATRRVPYRFFFCHWFPRNVSTLYCTGYLPIAVPMLGICTTAVLLLFSLKRSVLAGALLSSHYCCLLSIDVLVGAVALDVPGLTALVARDGVFKISCEGGQLGPFGL